MIKKVLIVSVFTLVIITLLNLVMGVLNSDTTNFTKKKENMEYVSSNVANENILVLLKVKEERKEKIWSQSFLKDEMLKEFPKFQNMRELVEDRLIDNGKFKEELLEKIKVNENRFIAGNASRADIFFNLTYL